MDSILKPLYIAVSFIMRAFHSLFSGLGLGIGTSWTLSIVGLVITIRIILIPLFVKQIKSQRALQVLQPKMKELQKKYKDDRQKQSEELMKLYKEHNTNPLASCLPILAQAPIFFALFRVLNSISGSLDKFGKCATVAAKHVNSGVFTRQEVCEAANAHFFGAKLSESFLHPALSSTSTMTVKVVTVILIVLMSATTFTTQRQLMMKGMPAASLENNPMVQQQKILLYVFPLIFAVSGINFPVGVLLYWLTTNLWTMGQQFYVIRNNPTPGSPAYDQWEARQARKKGNAIEEIEGPASDGSVIDGSIDGSGESSGQRVQPKRAKRPKKKK
jgi:YidC/Oxa1 family membrane protein insertase